MGACQWVTKTDDTDEGSARKYFEQQQREDEIENGNSPYGGGPATLGGLVFRPDVYFTTSDEACEYFRCNAQKWGPAIAVRVLRNEPSADLEKMEELRNEVDRAEHAAAYSLSEMIKGLLKVADPDTKSHLLCPHCKSKISTSATLEMYSGEKVSALSRAVDVKIRRGATSVTMDCLVCKEDVLRSRFFAKIRSDIRKYETAQKRSAGKREKIAGRMKKAVAKKKAAAKKKAKKSDYVWFIGGLCGC
jgi:hypothetical protein